jgi:hypothetical protein
MEGKQQQMEGEDGDLQGNPEGEDNQEMPSGDDDEQELTPEEEAELLAMQQKMEEGKLDPETAQAMMQMKFGGRPAPDPEDQPEAQAEAKEEVKKAEEPKQPKPKVEIKKLAHIPQAPKPPPAEAKAESKGPDKPSKPDEKAEVLANQPFDEAINVDESESVESEKEGVQNQPPSKMEVQAQPKDTKGIPYLYKQK